MGMQASSVWGKPEGFERGGATGRLAGAANDAERLIHVFGVPPKTIRL
jgi:hypothetical protein